MYLKKIEVNGFKSFAHKMVFEFDNGITGIVGPNGSGKSNIADAVRWVLGEQSAKQLRGSNMQDVIFAGTELRKAVGLASVSITIDNSDHALDIEYDEVTITRRVFRSGESEYQMNGNPCRLKDINELFYDTGIGKEGYSIIGQGQIDRILSGKSEERRELFDEAAGIVKFKRRKNAAVKSLENESNNLLRINDILAELEKQVGPLSRQSEKAKEYLQLKEGLKKYEVNLFLLETDSMKKNLDEVMGKLEIVDHQYHESSEKFEEIKKNYDEQNKILEETGAALEELIAKNNEGSIDRQRLETQINILEEQIRSVNRADESYQERIEALEEQVEERNEETEKLMKEKFALGEQIDEAHARKNEADRLVNEANARIDELTKGIDILRNNKMENLNAKTTIRSQIERNETLLEQIQIRKAALTRKILDFKTDVSAFDEELARYQKELDGIFDKISGLTRDNEDITSSVEELNRSRAQMKENLNRAKENELRTATKLESLRNIAERYDGYGNSIRKVMDEKSKQPGILGVVADLIKTDKKYEIAIETALGGNIQNVVTDTENTAKTMIEFLKKNQFGRATFLPLDAIRAKEKKDESALGEKGVIGFASELIDTDPKYREMCEYLLGRILVVDQIDNGLAVNRRHGYSLKIVTLEGEFLNSGGSMTGGAFRNQSNLLGRRREIEELEGKITEFKSQIKNYSEEIGAIDEKIRTLNETFGENRDEIQRAKLAQNKAQLSFDQCEAKKKELNAAFESDHKEEQDIESRLKELRDALETDKNRLVKLDADNEEADARIETDTASLEQEKLTLAGLSEKAQTVHVEYSQISQKGDYLEESLKRVLREVDRLKENIENLSLGKSDNEKEIAEKNHQIEQIRETIGVADKTLQSYAEEIAVLKGKKDELSEAMKDFFASREECQAEVLALEKEQFRLNQSRERLEGGRDARVEYMWDEYEITLSQAAALRDPELVSENELKARVNEARGQIRKLGDVNVNAIEEYKEVSERYEFLKKQHDDLVEGRDKLIAVIEELDTGMRQKFTEKFEEIKEEYDKVFKQLFGGGKGTLEIEPDVDILEADISIISQPPGKKLQNMMQLSGGEKALSAICLLFAIQNLKPSPFCLLDEIEAALDDSNVERYAKYLHKLTKHTQFIVITHRRGTMASADRLYGITMQEKGVSTLVSVDLIRDELDDKTQKD